MLTAPRVRTPSETRPNPMERPARPRGLVELANVPGLTDWRPQDIVVLSDQLLGLQEQSGALVKMLFSSFRKIRYRPRINTHLGQVGRERGRRRWNRKGEIMKGCGGCGRWLPSKLISSTVCHNRTVSYTAIQNYSGQFIDFQENITGGNINHNKWCSV